MKHLVLPILQKRNNLLLHIVDEYTGEYILPVYFYNFLHICLQNLAHAMGIPEFLPW